MCVSECVFFYIYQGCSCVLTCFPPPHLLLHTLGHTPSQVSPSFFSHTRACKNKTRVSFSIMIHSDTDGFPPVNIQMGGKQNEICGKATLQSVHWAFLPGRWLIHNNNKAMNYFTSDMMKVWLCLLFIIISLKTAYSYKFIMAHLRAAN